MVQVKKEAVRSAILDAAETLFTEKGYHNATLPQIAARARVSPSTVYVYFRSKMEIVYTIYGPWLQARLERLATEVEALESEREQLRLIVATIWQGLPHEDNGFANVLMQAVSSASAESDYDPGLLRWSEGAVAAMLLQTRGDAISRTRALLIAHLLFMSFDGFAMSARINPGSSCSDALVDTFVEMVMALPAA